MGFHFRRHVRLRTKMKNAFRLAFSIHHKKVLVLRIKVLVLVLNTRLGLEKSLNYITDTNSLQCITGCNSKKKQSGFDFAVWMWSCHLLMFVSCTDRYFPGFKQSVFHSKHQIDVLTGSQICLSDVLYDDVAFSYFTEVMLAIHSNSYRKKR